MGNAIKEFKKINHVGKVRILDVGGREGRMSHFLDHGDRLTVLDIRPGKEPNFIKGDGTKMPMFPNNSFDIVMSSDVFEHVLTAKRSDFISESLRVAKKLVILAAPFGNRITEKAEKTANRYYKDITGTEHEWLKEHIENGLPKETELTDVLNKKGWKYSVLKSNNINNWLLLQLVIFFSFKFSVSEKLVNSFYNYYNKNFLKLENPSEEFYRKIFFISKGAKFEPPLNYSYNPEKQLCFLKAAFDLVSRHVEQQKKEERQKPQHLPKKPIRKEQK